MLGVVVSIGVDELLLKELLVLLLAVLVTEELRVVLVLELLFVEEVELARLLVELNDATGMLGVRTSADVNGDQLLTASPALML